MTMTRDWLIVGNIRQPKEGPPPSSGYLAPYVPFIRYALQQGTTPRQIAGYLYDVRGVRGHPSWPLSRWSAVSSMATLIRNAQYINYGLPKLAPPAFPAEHYRLARKEHAFLLRCEGLTYRTIGPRLGVSHQTAHCLVYSFGRRLCGAIRRTKYALDI